MEANTDVAQRPTGTVTFLFTDIEGSTRLWESDPEAMQVALEQHDALMRAAIEARGGYVFKTVGDAFCATFWRADEALTAAIDAQRALEGADWPVLREAASLRVRMGLHTGEASERDGDYFGPPVNRAARLEAAGHGGQVLVSLATQQLIRDTLPEGVSLRDWGEHRLKDLRHAENIFQVEGPGLPAITTPPATAEDLHPRDRVVVHEAAPDESEVGDRALGQLNAVLEAAVVSADGDAVLLTPSEAAELARRKPAGWREYRLGRIAEWSHPRYRLDGRFVGLSLLVDQGEEAMHGRWQAADERYDDLRALLTAVDAPAVVVLGPPGSGKSTLLRHLELDVAIDALRGQGEGKEEGADVVTFFIQLNQYAPPGPGETLPAPGDWLAERWAVRLPELPPLADLLAEGRMLLLLDALNEMPAESESGFRQQVQLWKAWLQQLMAETPGNRVVFTCRSLDYSQPLSTPALRVPQVRIEPMSDDQVRDFLRVYSPARWREIWAALDGRPQLEVVRSPYFLALLVEQVEATGEMPAGRAGLFTGFVRQALRREVERGSPLFAPGELLASRDLKRLARWQWKTCSDLPERGILLPKLAALAQAMQDRRADGERSQVRIDVDDALDALDCAAAEAIVAAGEALAVLDEDQAADEVMYVHQLVQEFFAARALARQPDPELVRLEWRAARISPSVEEVIDSLDPADPLPGLPQTGWEETAQMAAAMSGDPVAFVQGVMATNLALAGRTAAQPELRAVLPGALLDELRWSLVRHSRDPEADLRARIASARALGVLGDPRLERSTGADGDYLRPPLVEIPGGTFPIGDDESIEWAGGTSSEHVPAHPCKIGPFAIGQLPVTNAEWALFVAAGGYDDERWWDTEAGRAWRRGESTAAGIHAGVRWFVSQLKERPEIMDEYVESGAWDDEMYARARRRVAMSDGELDAHLRELYPGGRHKEPAFWRDARFNHPAQPVVGICWYEARAFVSWLAAQSGVPFRLPTEVEWEAAARGRGGRRYAYGDEFDRLRCNTVETHVRQTTPVGVFPTGDTPEGVIDLAGSVSEWTSSAFGRDPNEAEYRYPYDPSDGRETPDVPADVQRVVRGGSWSYDESYARAVNRVNPYPDYRYFFNGCRVAVSRSPRV